MTKQDNNFLSNIMRGLYAYCDKTEQYNLMHLMSRLDNIYHTTIAINMVNNYEAKKSDNELSFADRKIIPQIGDVVYFLNQNKLIDHGIIIELSSIKLNEKEYVAQIKNFTDQKFFISTRNIYSSNPFARIN